MLHNIKDLVSIVRVRAGMHPGNGMVVRCRDPDTLRLDDIVSESIVRNANAVAMTCPLCDLAGSGHSFDDGGIYWHEPVNGSHSGHLLLPDDFLRLVTFRMSDWAMPVTQTIDTASPQYTVCHSTHPGLRGSCQRPLCILQPLPEGIVLEFQSCADNSQCIVEAAYMPRVVLDNDGMIDIHDRLLPAIINNVTQEIKDKWQ